MSSCVVQIVCVITNQGSGNPNCLNLCKKCQKGRLKSWNSIAKNPELDRDILKSMRSFQTLITASLGPATVLLQATKRKSGSLPDPRELGIRQAHKSSPRGACSFQGLCGGSWRGSSVKSCHTEVWRSRQSRTKKKKRRNSVESRSTRA